MVTTPSAPSLPAPPRRARHAGAWLLCALAVGSGHAAAAPLPQEDARHAVELVSRDWREGVTPERMLSLEQLAHFDSPVAVDGLLDIFERGEVAMYPLARRILGSYTEPDSVKRLLKQGLQSRDAGMRAQVLLALGENRPAGLDWAALAAKALDDPAPEVRAAAISLLGRARTEGALTRILALAADDHERVRMEVPGALVRLAGARAEPLLDSLLTDPRWRVRLAAARALADLRTPQAAARLAQALALEHGRLREDLEALLVRLTGRSFEADPVRWRQYLDTAPPDLLTRGDTMALTALAPPQFSRTESSYYSIGTLSQHFVLVTDLSGSMETPVRLLTESTPRPRIDIAQQELERLIGGLKETVSFGLVSFRDDAVAWHRQLVPGGEHDRRAALTEVAGYRAAGGTNICAALDIAFDMAQAAMDSPTDSFDAPDTLFLLSDGVATVGTIRDAGLLLQYVAERNRTLQLRIHCVALTGEAQSRDFLRRLAEIGTGRYVELVAKSD